MNGDILYNFQLRKRDFFMLQHVVSGVSVVLAERYDIFFQAE